jgi:hypothetical protein
MEDSPLSNPTILLNSPTIRSIPEEALGAADKILPSSSGTTGSASSNGTNALPGTTEVQRKQGRILMVHLYFLRCAII